MPKETTTKNFSSCCNDCGDNHCCHNDYHGGKYVLLRWLLGLLILAITFAIGMKLGEFKAGMWEAGFYPGVGMGNVHYRMMDSRNRVYPPLMMQDSAGTFLYDTAPAPATPSTPKKTAPSTK